MIYTIEHSVAAHLNAEIENAEFSFSATAIPTMSLTPKPTDRALILCKIEDLPEEVPGRELWTGHLVLYVEIPANVQSVTVDQIPLMEALVTAAFAPGKLSALASHFTGAIQCTGLARTGWKPGKASTSFMPHLAVTLAIHN